METSWFRRARARIDLDGWKEVLGISAVIFLTLMVAGAVLLLAGKLQFPSLGTGAGTWDILRAIALVALTCLGVTVDVDGLPLAVIPLGALAVVAWSGARVARDVFRARSRTSTVDVVAVGVGFAALTFIAALVFRFGGSVPVTASPGEAAGLGFVWGSAVAAIGRSLAAPPGSADPLDWVPNETLARSLRLTVPTTVAASAGTLIALLCAVIGRLAADPLPRPFGLGDALAALIYLVAFLPNVLIALFSLGVGATLTIGAQVGVAGEVVGPLQERSLFGWGGRTSPVLFLLVLVPLFVSVGAGMLAAEREAHTRSLVTSGVIAAGVFSFGVFLLASISDARLGAGLVDRKGIGLVAVDALQAGVLTFLWMCVAGGFGAALHRKLRSRSEDVA